MNESLEIIATTKSNIQKIYELIVKDKDVDIKDLFETLKSDIEKIYESFSFVLHENAEQKKEIQKLMAQIAGEHGLNVKNNVYYAADGDGPFCPFCYKKRRKKIRLRTINTDDNKTVHYACRMCDNKF